MLTKRMQQALQAQGLDGWLFTGYDAADPYCRLLLGVKQKASVRWFYLVPATGEPVKVVTALESDILDNLPGEKAIYKGYDEVRAELKKHLHKGMKLAMQYSPLGKESAVGRVDAGTVELVKSYGCEIVSSSELLGVLLQTITTEQAKEHHQTGKKVHAIKDEAFAMIAEKARAQERITTYEVQQLILKRLAEEGLTCDGDEPIVAIDEDAASPHYHATRQNARAIKEGDLVLLDLWARKDAPMGVYYDITWMAFVGKDVPDEYTKLFAIIVKAREAALATIRGSFALGTPCTGKQADAACRKVITDAGYGEAFIHGTGHSIDITVHGMGVNLRATEERRLRKESLFSVEPGIYVAGKYGFRTEIDVYVDAEGKVRVTGPEQKEVLALLS